MAETFFDAEQGQFGIRLSKGDIDLDIDADGQHVELSLQVTDWEHGHAALILDPHELDLLAEMVRQAQAKIHQNRGG